MLRFPFSTFDSGSGRKIADTGLKMLLCSMLFVLCSLPLSAEILDVQVLWNVDDEPLNIGDTIHFKVTVDSPGSVIVDISTVHQSIQLYDNGTNGDPVPGDLIFELDYIIFEGDTVEAGPILARHITDDGVESSTTPDDGITPHITMDGTRPVITNDDAIPNPFNPNVQYTYIRYVLTERAMVTIMIYDDQDLPVRQLGTPTGQPGENHTTWDGTDDEGNAIPDGIYKYRLGARDSAGNDAVVTEGNCVLTTVYMEIDDTLITPNPFSPDGDDVVDTVSTSFTVRVFADESQLRVLGFGFENLITATTEDDDTVSPYALMGLSIFNSSGNAIYVFNHDFYPYINTDFAPNGWPNGEWPPDVPPGSGNFLGLPDGASDWRDWNDKNDWDTLVPLNGPFLSESGKQYYLVEFVFQWVPNVSLVPDGTYLVKIEAELVGRTWNFVGELFDDKTQEYLGESWHAIPSLHHGIIAPPRVKSVVIDRAEPLPVDDDPPLVAATVPSAGAIMDPTKEQIREILVIMNDGADGSGVDPVESSISLLDPLGSRSAGQITPVGVDTIRLALDYPLIVSGDYTIVVYPVDKRGNKYDGVINKFPTFVFSVEDREAPTVVPNTVRPRPTDFDDEGNPIESYAQPIGVVSVILTDGPTGTGVDLDNSILYLRNSMDEAIPGELAADPDNNELTYTLKESLAVSDTYTIVVIAVDGAGARGIYTYMFVLDMAENIVIGHGDKTYLVIYAATTVLGGTEDSDDLLGSITVEETDEFPDMLMEISPLTEVGIRFEPGSIELSQEADLTMYYDDSQLPLGISETELSIYAYKRQTKGWVRFPNIVLLENENELTAETHYIDEYYIIAYTSSVVPSQKEVLLEPPKYFNPDRESLTFTFAPDMTNYEVQIYSVGGDKIADLKGQGRTDSSLGWDGRNENNELVRNGIFICRILYSVDGRSQSLNRLIAIVR